MIGGMRMDCSDGELFVTRPEAERRLGVHRPFRRALKSGEIPQFYFGDWPRVRWADVLAWADRMQRPVSESAHESQGETR